MTPRKLVAVVALVLATTVFGGVARANDGFHPDFTYQVPIREACKQQAGSCGGFSIWREEIGRRNRVELAVDHNRCLRPLSVKYFHSRSIFVAGKFFSFRINRPNLKVRIRGRFYDRKNGISFIKGTYSFSNLNRNCGIPRTGFRQRMWTPPHEGH